MLLNPTSDQGLLQETTDSYLSGVATPEALRANHEDPAGFDAGYWRQGAELGWVSLLVPERFGGGSVGEHGLVDLTLVAHEFGRHAAPGPLIPSNVVAAVLGRSGADEHGEVIEQLLAGTATASWCLLEHAPHDGLGDWQVEIAEDGDEVVVTGLKRPVEAVTTSDFLLVTGRTGDGLTNVLVPASADGVTTRPLKSIDLSRRYGAVQFAGVRLPKSAVVGEIGGADADVWSALDTALVIAAAESVGAMQRSFDMTVEWAFDRYSFGRPLASYQALKHRFADMKSWLEGSHAIADEAAEAVATGAANASDKASAAAAFIGEYGPQIEQDCIQIHGGIGVTFEHDLHIYLRRVVVNRLAYGSPGEHLLRLTDLTERRLAAKGGAS